MKIIKAGGGLVYRKGNDGIQVLLIRRNGKWDLPKGKLEKGETMKECARREVTEETGIPLPDVIDFLVTTYHEYKMNNQTVGKKTDWFLMNTGDPDPSLKPEENEGITEIRWVSADDGLMMVDYDNLVSVLQAFLKRT